MKLNPLASCQASVNSNAEKFAIGNRNRVSLWGMMECITIKGKTIQIIILRGLFLKTIRKDTISSKPIGKRV